jgi:hypothetical protein
LSSLGEQDVGVEEGRDERVEGTRKEMRRKWGPKEDWPTGRPSGQLSYVNTYDTGVLQNQVKR